MAMYDANERKIVVRVIFDGPGFAGKTTNIQRLYGFFTERRRSELVVPEQIDGRTQFFDWMHLDGGLVQGYGLRCQLVSVPGQRVLNKRRWKLLRGADVVVFVCEATPSGVEEAQPMFALLREYMVHRFAGSLPLVVQANKQDLPGALEAEEIRRRLVIDPEVPVVAASAEGSIGVRETAVLAIRTAANRVQALVLEHGIDGLQPGMETADQVLEQLRAVPADPEGRVVVEIKAPDAAGAEAPDAAGAEAPVAAGAEAPVAAGAEAPVAPEPPVAPVEPVAMEPPPQPSPDAPSGFIWPAATGRDVLRRVVTAGQPQHRVDLAAQSGLAVGSGGSDTLIFQAGPWCLKTSRRRLYGDVDEGRAALLKLARRKVALAHLLPPDTVLSLREDGDRRCWLWTVSRWVPPLRQRMREASDAHDELRLTVALQDYARAAVAAAQLAATRGVVLDVHPSNFAAADGHVYYLDDDIDVGGAIPAFGHAVLQRVLEYEARAGVVRAFVDALIEAVGETLHAGQLQALELEASFTTFNARTAATAEAQERIVNRLRALQRARAPVA